MSELSILNKIRSVLAKVWQRTEIIVKLAVKFLAFYYLFHFVAGMDMFSHLPETFIFHSGSIQLVLALVTTLLPNRSGVLIALLMIVYSVFQTSLIGAILVGLALLLLYVASASLFPEYVYLVPLTALCLYHHQFLLVPLFCGMYIGAIAVVPVVLGIVTFAVVEIIPLFTGLEMGALDALPQLITDASESGIDKIAGNDEIVFLMVVFSIVILLGALLRKLKVNFARYIALGVSSLFGIIALMIGVGNGRVQGTAGGILLTSLLLVAVLLFLELLKVSVSYEGSQSLEFEDENYVYQVRMIPKMSRNKSKNPADGVELSGGRVLPVIRNGRGKKVAEEDVEIASRAASKASRSRKKDAEAEDRAFSEEDLTNLRSRDRVALFGEPDRQASGKVFTEDGQEIRDARERVLLPGDEPVMVKATTHPTPVITESETIIVPDEEMSTKILEDATRIADADTKEKVTPNVRNVLSDDDEPLDLFQEYDEKHS